MSRTGVRRNVGEVNRMGMPSFRTHLLQYPGKNKSIGNRAGTVAFRLKCQPDAHPSDAGVARWRPPDIRFQGANAEGVGGIIERRSDTAAETPSPLVGGGSFVMRRVWKGSRRVGSRLRDRRALEKKNRNLQRRGVHSKRSYAPRRGAGSA